MLELICQIWLLTIYLLTIIAHGAGILLGLPNEPVTIRARSWCVGTTTTWLSHLGAGLLTVPSPNPAILWIILQGAADIFDMRRIGIERVITRREHAVRLLACLLGLGLLIASGMFDRALF